MRYCVNRLVLIAFALATFIDLSAQDKKNQTLLWRIQKGNERPSFLFGTMHVSDKKAFHFRDSLYAFLEQAEAFALELNPDSANQIIAAYMSGELSKDMGDWPEQIAPPDPDSLLQIISENSLKAETLKEENPGVIDLFVRRLINNQKKQAESMNTFMDAFLYEIARQHGKKMYGLEELDGQGEALKALSRGFKPKKVGNLLNKWNSSQDESPVHRHYLNEDIDSIDQFYNEFFTESALDIFLYDRNEVMANRMDSLIQRQTLFAAVGAGHLAGKKGVIELLRKKGYTVDPVFSQNRIPAEQYKFKLTDRNWQLEKSDEFGIQYQLPGISQRQDGIKGRKMVFHYDIGGGTLFMTLYGKLSSSERKKNLNEIVTGHLDEMLQAYGGRVLSRKSIFLDSVKVIESLCLFNDNTYYRYRELVKDNLFYILSVGSQKKDNLSTEKAEKYFSSLKIIPIPPTRWTAFPSAVDGFSVLLPGKPIVENVPVEKESAGMISLRSYSYFDANTGVDYFMTSGKALGGNQYPEGESFFQNYIDHLKQLTGEEPKITDTLMNGYPCKMFTTRSTDNQVQGFVVKRANTCYYLIAQYEAGSKTKAEAEKFLQSFNMTAFEQPVWNRQQSPSQDFTAWLPGTITKKLKDSTAYDFVPGEVQYYGYDPFSAMSYNVEVYPINKYYWAPHIDSVYSLWQNKVMNSWRDTLLGSSSVKNAGLTGRELLLMDKNNKEKRRIRLLLNGNKMYVLVNAVPLTYGDEKNAHRFFNEFSVNREETAVSILENNPNKLFDDLQSKDSTTFQQAYNALSEVKFMEKDIMLLMEKATLQYPSYENNYQSVNVKLLSSAEQLIKKDEIAYRKKTIDFIKAIYTKENKAVDSIRFSLLGLVAAGKTVESFQLVKELLATKKHGADYNYHLFGKLYDSIELTRSLYPDLLHYISDTTMSFAIVSLTKKMIDSSQLSVDMLLSVKPELIKLAKKQVKEVNKEDYDLVYLLPDLIDLVSYLKQKETDDIIAGFLKAKNTWIKEAAALALVRNNKTVSARELMSIAKDPELRVDLYEELKKLKKEGLFPADFRTQVGLAEGYIFNAVYDEDESDSRPELIFIKKMEYEYKGSKKLFYIFRANYQYDAVEEADMTVQVDAAIAGTESESYFTLAGPFDPDKSKLEIDEKENISGMWYDDKFDGWKNDYFFRKYIERELKWQEEQKKRQ